MEDTDQRFWSRFVHHAMEHSPEFRGAFDKERQLFRTLASAGELGERVTVMCCGDGREVEMLLNLHREFPQIKELNGVDLLSTSINQVREKVRSNVQGVDDVHIRLLQEDATNTSIEPHSQDTVTCMLTMVNFNDTFIAAFCEHVARILKPGGTFIFSVYNHDAFDARMEMYTTVEAPVEHAEPSTGLVTFGEGFEEASFSRQFDQDHIQRLIEASGLHVRHYDGRGITHLGIAEKAVTHEHERISLFHQTAVAASVIALLGGALFMKHVGHQKDRVEDLNSRIVEVGPGIFLRVDLNKEREGRGNRVQDTNPSLLHPRGVVRRIPPLCGCSSIG